MSISDLKEALDLPEAEARALISACSRGKMKTLIKRAGGTLPASDTAAGLLEHAMGLIAKMKGGADKQPPPAPSMTRDERGAVQSKTLLIVGECGDGKSTLVNLLCGIEEGSRDACKTGMRSSGVTKEIVDKKAKPIGGCEIIILDSPGVGDRDVSPMQLLTLIEAALSAEGQRLDGVIVTTKVSDCRVRMGAQVVMGLVDKGFVAPGKGNKWQSIILCGTQADRATEEQKHNFLHGSDGDKSVVATFFEQAPGNTGPCAMTSKDDISQLLAAIENLTPGLVAYEQPDSEQMGERMAKLLGLDKEVFTKQLEAEREEMRKEQEELKAELKALAAARAESERRAMLEMQKLSKDGEEKARAIKEQFEKQLAEKDKAMRERDEKTRKEVEERMRKLEEERQKEAARQNELQEEARRKAEEKQVELSRKYDEAMEENRVARLQRERLEDQQREERARLDKEREEAQRKMEEERLANQRAWELRMTKVSAGLVSLGASSGWTAELGTAENNTQFSDWMKQFPSAHVALAFGPALGWALCPNPGNHGSRGSIPNGFSQNEKVKAKTNMEYISFGPSGRYFVKFADGSTAWAGPQNLTDAIKAKEKERIYPSSVVFGPSDSWWVRFNNGATVWRGLPDAMSKVLKEMDKSAKHVAINEDSGWFILKESGWQYSGIPESLNKLIKTMEGDTKKYVPVKSVHFGAKGTWAIEIK